MVEDGNHRCTIFDGESGRFVRKFGSEGKADGEFSAPCAITTDAHGHLLILDRDTNRMQVFDANGQHCCTRELLGLNQTGYKGTAWRSGAGCVAIANSESDDVLIYGPVEAEAC